MELDAGGSLEKLFNEKLLHRKLTISAMKSHLETDNNDFPA